MSWKVYKLPPWLFLYLQLHVLKYRGFAHSNEFQGRNEWGTRSDEWREIKWVCVDVNAGALPCLCHTWSKHVCFYSSIWNYGVYDGGKCEKTLNFSRIHKNLSYSALLINRHSVALYSFKHINSCQWLVLIEYPRVRALIDKIWGGIMWFLQAVSGHRRPAWWSPHHLSYIIPASATCRQHHSLSLQPYHQSGCNTTLWLQLSLQHHHMIATKMYCQNQ